LVISRSIKDITEISKKELWLMGIILYWRERMLNGKQTDLYRGVRFTSSDDSLVKLFLKWLMEIGKIEKHEILFDIFAKKQMRRSFEYMASHWSAVTGFDKEFFMRVYYLKSSNKKRRYQQAKFGYLRIRVKSSSYLARQIAGWIEAIKILI